MPLIVDAGVGTASDAALAMELGYEGVLMNTAIAEAEDSVAMATAMNLAVEAGRHAYRRRTDAAKAVRGGQQSGRGTGGPLTRPASSSDLERLEQERVDADDAYNRALSALDRAVPGAPAIPGAPAP